MPEGAGSAATDFSAALLGELVALGVRHLVVSPGSRSQALALVAAELERAGRVRLHVRVDERVAAFTALGIGLESGVPAVVVTTSGTAAAELHPAVLEARAAGVPLIVLTADRPAELRGIRANQAADQVGLFGSAVVWSRDVHADDFVSGADVRLLAPLNDQLAPVGAASIARELLAASLTPGPAHLNIAFRVPLSAPWRAPEEPVPTRERLPPEALSAPARPDRGVERMAGGRRTVVIAGSRAGEEAETVARAGGWPLVAEPSSGARFGPNLVVAYRELLSDPRFGGAVERAVVFGHPTLSREVPALLERDDVDVVVVDPVRDDFYNPGRRARAVAAIEVDAEPDRSWVGSWVAASRELVEREASVTADQLPPDQTRGHTRDPKEYLEYARAELAAVREPVTRRMLVDALWRFTWPQDRLVLGASQLIRDLDRTVGGKKITVHASRGLAGIDGTVATATGVALALADTARPGVTRALMGDLTLLHDVGALLRDPAETLPPIQVVVGNDRGGRIFTSLEVAETADPAAFERVVLTPRDADLAQLAAAYGWRYLRASTRGELDQALSAITPEPTLVEVPLP